jgi:HSP20 family molecular chaperone IbpA
MKDKEIELKEKKEIKKVAGEGTRPGPVFIPAVDILENAKEIIVLADMPGVESKSVTVDLKDNQLTITGKVGAPEGEKEISLYKEFNWGIISGSSPFRT